MKKKVKPKKENGERWLLTYSDMITLLLALFILLYGMSNVDQQKYEALADALNQSLGDGNGRSIFDGSDGVLDNNGSTIFEHNNGSNGQSSNSAATSVTPSPTQGASDTITTEEDMNQMEEDIIAALAGMNVNDAVGTDVNEGRLHITLKDDEFFDSGKAELKNSMKKSLSEIAKILKRVKNPIIIEGYTDNLPISSSIYSSNWQLSTARASAVAQYLQEEKGVDSSRLTASGHADNDPIASNDTKDGRSKNRRVVITILYSGETGMEFQ